MKSTKYEISKIPTNIKTLFNFQEWINIGQQLEVALLIGLIEYHFRVYQIEIIKSKLLQSDQQNEAMTKINNLINISQKQPSQFKSFIQEISMQDPQGYYCQETMQAFFRSNQKTNIADQIPFLCQTFNVKFHISETTNSQTFSNNTIILHKYQDYYYLVFQQIDKCCVLCKTQFNLIILQCQHKLCQGCLKKEINSLELQIPFKCPQISCIEPLDKYFYQSLLNQYKDKDISSSNNQKSIIILELNQDLQENLIQNQKQSNKINQNQNSIIKVKQEEQKQSQETLHICVKCKNQQGQKEIIKTQCRHYYCKSCILELCNNRNKFVCFECHTYVSINLTQLQIENNNENLNQKCCKCKQIQNISFLFQNSCLDYVCASCLEGLIQKQIYLRCPQCARGIKEKEISVFFDKLLILKLEQTKQLEEQQIQQEQVNEICQQINLKQSQNRDMQLQQQYQQIDNKQISNFRVIQQTNQKDNLILFDEPKNCSFCNSPFTEYNIHQQLPHCQNINHYIGVCCVIFPLNCPQCQLQSLHIEKDSLRFQLPLIIGNDTSQYNLNI